MRSLTAERRANRGREGGEKKKRERKGEKGEIRKVPYMSALLRTGVAIFIGVSLIISYLIKKEEWPALFSWLLAAYRKKLKEETSIV